MRATLGHFLGKMGLQRPGGPSSKVTPFPPSSDSSLPESLRVPLLHTFSFWASQSFPEPVLARTGKLGNTLQSNLKSKLAASEKTDIVRCSSRFLDFDVQ